jgi:hypothetical protein
VRSWGVHLLPGAHPLRYGVHQYRLRPQQLRWLRGGVCVEPDLPQQRLCGPVTFALMTWLVLGGAELITGRDRAVTLEPGERRTFRVVGVQTLTGNSGRCIEEAINHDEIDSVALTALCGGVRTMLVWKKTGERVHLLACAEGDDRPAAALALRKTLQTELKNLKSMTACVRNGRVELWGWAHAPAELGRVVALERKYGLDRVRNFVELVEPET